MQKLIKRIKDLLYNKSLLIRMIMSYVLIGSIMFSMFSFVVIYKISSSLTGQVISVTQEMLLQASNTSDIILSSIYSYYYDIYKKDVVVSNVLYSRSLNDMDLYDAGNKVNELTRANSLVKSVYLISSSTGVVVSNLSPVKTIDNFFDKAILQLITQNSHYGGEFFIPRQGSFQIDDTLVNGNLISIIYATDSVQSDNRLTAMVVNIDQDAFQEMVNKGAKDSTSISMVINTNGTVVAHMNSGLVGQNLSSEQYIQRITSTTAQQGYFFDKFDGKKALIIYRKSDKNGWYYISISRYNEMLGKGNTLLKTIAYSAGFFILISLIIAGFFGWIFYKPVYLLIRKMNEYARGGNGGNKQNEYDFISETFNSLWKDARDLEQSVNKYMPAQKREIIRKVINGEYNTFLDNPVEILKTVDVEFSFPYLMVAVFKIDAFSEIYKHEKSGDIALLRYAIANISYELFEKDFAVELAECGDDTIGIILNVEGVTEEWFAKIQDIILEIQETLEKHFNITLTASIGDIVNTLEDINQSYKDALYAANYRLIYGKNSIIWYRHIVKAERMDYQYPAENEKKIIDCFNVGNREKFESEIKRFMEKIQLFSCNEIMLSISQLMLALEKSASKIGVDRENAHDGVLWKLNDFETLDDIESCLIQYYNNVNNVRNTIQHEDKKSKVVDKIISYIEEHYQEANLSVELIADYVGLSTNYVRSIFKDITSKSLSDYISEKRFERICDLLISTDYSVKDVAEMTGLSTTGYFYTVFKKYFGCTPDQYRKIHKK